MKKPNEDVMINVLFHVGMCIFFITTFFVIIIFIASLPMDWAKSINDFADILAGFFMPITIVFLILNYFQQKKQLKNLEKENMKNIQRAQYSVLSPIYYDILKENYNEAFRISEFTEINDLIDAVMGYCHFGSRISSLEVLEEVRIIKNKIGEKLGDKMSEKIFFRRVNSYFHSYIQMRKLYEEAYSEPDEWQWRRVILENSPLDETAYGYVGRRLAFYFRSYDMVKEADKARGGVHQSIDDIRA